VVLGALEVIHLLALRLGSQVQAFLAPLVSAAAKVLGDNKLAIRQEYNRLFLQLMKAAGPQQVLDLLLQQECLQHKNSRVREEVVNICIVALLTYPSEELDLAKLAFGLAPALVDSKRRVRHAAMEAFAVLASSMGPGKTALLFKAVDSVELEDNGDGVMHAVQARLARKTLPKLVDHGFVEYAMLLPSSGPNRGSCLPHGADTDWLLMGNRTQSAHSYCGYHARGDALQSSSLHGACADPGVTSRRVLSAGKGKNKLPWENEHAGDGEGGSGVKMPLTKAVEQQLVPVLDELMSSATLRRLAFNKVSNKKKGKHTRCGSLHRRLEAVPSVGGKQEPWNILRKFEAVSQSAMGSHQPQISGKCGTLGHTQTRGKSGSVDSDLQFLGLNNRQQDKGPNASQGAFILPSYPLSSPRNSPKHGSSPADSPKKSQDRTMNFSNSWPLKSFEGLPKPSSQKQLLRQKSGDNTGENLQEKHSPLQLKPTLVRHPASRRGLNGTRPVPPIPRLASPLPDKIELNVTKWRREECEDTWLNEEDSKLAADLSEPNVDGEEVDQEEMQNSLRSLRNSAAKKRAKLSSNISDLESPDSALKLDLSADSPSHASSPSAGSCSESGVYSQESQTSPMSTEPQRRRITSDTFPLLGSKSQPARVPSARSRDPSVAEHNSSAGLADSVSGFPQMNNLDFISPSVLSEDAVVIVGKGVFGSPPARTRSQSITCIVNGDDQAVKEETEPSSGICGRSIQQNSAAHFHVENEREIKVVLSKSAQDKMRRKKREEKEHNHKEHQELKDLKEKEENPWERLKLNEPEKKTTESEVSPGAQGCYKDRTPSVAHSPEVMDPSELQPFSKPEVALTEALTFLADDDCHLHSAVRRCTAQHLSDIVERMGPEWILSGTKAVADRIFPAIARFAQDSSQQTRYYGRKMLFSIMTHPDFDKTLEKYVPAKDLPYIKESVSNLREKGLGEIPLDTPSAKGRRSHTSSVGHSRSSSTSRDALNNTDRETTEAREVTRKPAPRNSLENEEYVKDITGLLNAKDFRDRINGIKQLLSDTEKNQGFVVANIVKIFDAFKSRLHDSNSKVNQVALETMHKMIPLLKDNLSPVINMLIPAMVDNNLNSKNPGIYAAATNVIQALCQHLDNYLLLQPFCTKAQYLNGKAKQDMTEKLAVGTCSRFKVFGNARWGSAVKETSWQAEPQSPQKCQTS
ncbi:PREDICTED: protein FAM179B, partial [Chlamydotis macqueenii]|uniref:protein FAM179B n=1 Tax=Chlamydotis macqueenii TaxID=187382 RepID=UPI0005297CB6